ncbi:hypothetical protein CLOSTMETH_01212 [[Clostridium] methylpentosum DSM 5476]|uniref:Uncharacterized protein n=1 Tax=[Clostridium] methylpentosum DSM 5476 TaxID=537013 RepID=C0EBJ4_9FIRM|nr:hypothetical protein CLOSTMETH_01212 [[Clostridium] methylpentosum DSM 5476]
MIPDNTKSFSPAYKILGIPRLPFFLISENCFTRCPSQNKN